MLITDRLTPEMLVALDQYLTENGGTILSRAPTMSRTPIAEWDGIFDGGGFLYLEISRPCSRCAGSPFGRLLCDHDMLGWIYDSNRPLGGYWTRSNGG